MPKMKLFFIPHAGGSAMGYMTFKRFLDADFIEPIALEPAGRGQRIKEPCYKNLTDCAKDLLKQLKKEVGTGDYAIFGHSMGSLLAYEVARLIHEEGMKEPKCLFLSGRCAPNAEFDYPKLKGLDDEAFIKTFSKYQAMPQELLQNEQIMKVMFPIIRADIEMADDYKYRFSKKFGVDIISLYGDSDPMVTKQGIEDWGTVTLGAFYSFKFHGGHFYYSDQKKAVGELITKMMRQYT